MQFDNYFKLEIEAKRINESFARGAVAMFCTETSANTFRS